MSTNSPSHFPVTIVAGLPGSGKSSLISQAIPGLSSRAIAVFSNAPDLASQGSVQVRPFSDDQLEWKFGGGTIKLSQDLLIDIGRMASKNEFETAIIEWNGTLDLMGAVDTFSFDLDGEKHSLSDTARLDTLVSVINSSTFLKDFRESRELRSLGLARDKYDERTLTDLLVEQMEWSDIIVLNKTDRTHPTDLASIRAFAEALNPRAVVCEARHGLISSEIVQTGRCKLDKVGRFETWLPLQPHSSEKPSGKVTAVFFEGNRPFHPERLHHALEGHWDNVLRSKGLLWLANKSSQAGIWSQAGDLIDMDWASWEKPQSVLDSGRGSSQDTPPAELGKPRQQLLLIGTRLPSERIQQGLKRALLTDEEMKMPRSTWERFPDPFSFDAPVSD